MGFSRNLISILAKANFLFDIQNGLKPVPIDVFKIEVFAGATNTPLACMLMGIELFGSDCGIYVAIACVVSYLFSGHNSIYGRQVVGEAKHSRFSNYSDKTISSLK